MTIIQKLIISAIILFVSIVSYSCRQENELPNIILILSDDLGYNDIGCYGQTKIITPNIDKLAETGLRFTQHYAGSSICAPSRASLMTGKHTGHTSIRGNDDFLLKDIEITVAEILKSKGYETACIGKWGIGHPPPPDDPQRNGFDYFFGALSMWHAHNYYPEFLWRNENRVELNNVCLRMDEHYKEGQRELTGYAIEKNEYTSDLYTKDAIDWIESRENPFFLYLAYTAPHANNEATELGAEHGMEVPDYGIYENMEWPNAEKGKAAMITRMDSDIGKLISKIKELDEYENTLILFTSDNGPHIEGGVDPEFFDSNGELRGIKRDLYEGGIRVPLVVSWPSVVKSGTSTDHISAFWDILPTLADIVDHKVESKIDGISFLPTLLGEENLQVEHESLYWELHEDGSQQAVRMGNWKGIKKYPSEKIELYDLSNDISEKNDIADKYPEIRDKIENIMKAERDDIELWPLKPVY